MDKIINPNLPICDDSATRNAIEKILLKSNDACENLGRICHSIKYTFSMQEWDSEANNTGKDIL